MPGSLPPSPPVPAASGDLDTLATRCLEALPDVVRARALADELAHLPGGRTSFALCLVSLELALRGDARAREELPAYTGILIEAFRDPSLAAALVGSNERLAHAWKRTHPVVQEFVEAKYGRPPPPPPPAVPPPPPPPEEFVVDEAAIVAEAAPLPHAHAVRYGTLPPPRPESAEERRAGLRSFWRFTEENLGRTPKGLAQVLDSQSFATTKEVDRARLVKFANELLTRFSSTPEARALSCLTFLYVASQQRERGLFRVNRERLEDVRMGLLLMADPEPAARAAALFEADGPETQKGFGGVVELVHGYLAFCWRNRLDPRLPEAAMRFTASVG